jgi:hypothetical protein
MTKRIVALATLGVSVVLTACGGNGGGGGAQGGAPGSGGSVSVAASNAVAEGAWHSEQANGDVLDILILENGSLYALSVGATSSNPLLAFDQGSYTLSGNTLSAQLTHYNDHGTFVTGTVSGTVVAGTSITGTAATNGNPNTNAFAVRPIAVSDSTYDYTMAASLSRIAGGWTTGTLLYQSNPIAFSIDPNGVLAGTNLGCSFTGQFRPSASGKNVFNVTMAFGQTPCATPGLTVSGVAISYSSSNGKQQLKVALQDASKTLGTMLYAQR